MVYAKVHARLMLSIANCDVQKLGMNLCIQKKI